MAKSIDQVLQSDGTWKWEVVELQQKKLHEAPEVCPAPEPKATKKKVAKKKTDSPISE